MPARRPLMIGHALYVANERHVTGLTIVSDQGDAIG